MNLWKIDWTPMLLKEQLKPFNSKDYIYEVKFDGIRAIIFATSKKVTIKSRNGKDLTSLFPELHLIQELVKEDTIFDGEIIALESGKPSFRKIQNRLHLKEYPKIEVMCKRNPVIFMCFDILYQKKDLTKLQLLERKKILSKIADNEVFVKVKYIEEYGTELFESVKKMNLEGIVAKEKKSTYEINRRGNEWIKIKHFKVETYFIAGFIENKTNVSLLLAEKRKIKFYYVGKVSMFKENPLFNQLKEEKIQKNTIENCDEKATFISPRIKCKVKYLEKTKEGILRHPVLKK